MPLAARTLLPLTLLLARPGCAWLGPDAAHRDMLAARRARSAAMAPDPPIHMTVEERLEEADRLLAGGRGGEAIWSYAQAVRQDPENPTPRTRIGFVEVSRNPERAEALFSEIVRDHPDSSEAHAGLGLARFAQNRLQPAREALERAVELDPESASALYWLAVVYDLQDDHVRARELAERAHGLSPKDARIVNNLGVSYLTSGEFEKAEEAFRAAILLDPAEDAAVHNNLGLAVGRQGRYDEAMAEFRRAGTEQAALNNLGYLYYLNGEHAKAIDQFERSLQTGGGDRLTVVKNLQAAQSALDRGL
ncbi:MAG: tetratricopeptide repeat protein [Myxococcales bacterium]|nr:MAG: tetratricopeptide repeat protein [Myxococcales bacterium]